MMGLLRAKPVLALIAACALACARAGAAAVPTGAPVDGIRCDAMEGAVMHIHQHLAIRAYGTPVAIPDDVGRPLLGGCLYWLHTHTPDGIIHVEAPTFRTFTLGEFFDVWGEPLSPGNVAGVKPKARDRVMVWVDGKPYTGDPRKIELVEHLDVTLEIGPPYRRPAPFVGWNGN